MKLIFSRALDLSWRSTLVCDSSMDSLEDMHPCTCTHTEVQDFANSAAASAANEQLDKHSKGMVNSSADAYPNLSDSYSSTSSSRNFLAVTVLMPRRS
jgi:hypothetical protein